MIVDRDAVVALQVARLLRSSARLEVSGARANDDADRADGYFRETAALTAKMMAGLPTNRALIDHIKRHGLQKI